MLTGRRLGTILADPSAADGQPPLVSPDVTIRLRPERTIAGGEALARDADGRVVFVRGALGGELVDVEVVEAKKDWARARVVDVVEPSAHRVEPPCPQRRLGCGGCDWQHVAPAAQPSMKAEIVLDALRRTGRLADPSVVDGGAVPTTGYRTSLRVVGTAEGRAGLRLERSHDTVDAAGCLVAHPVIGDLLDRLGIPPGLEVALHGSVATGAVTAVWDGADDAVSGLPSHVAVGRRAALVEVVDGHRLRVSAQSFFQSGPAAAELLVAAVRRAAPELAGADHVVDAYAGVGLFAVAAADPSSTLTLIELSKSSASDASVNVAGRATTIVRREVGAWRADPDEDVDIVIADPARSGLGRPGVNALVPPSPMCWSS